MCSRERSLLKSSEKKRGSEKWGGMKEVEGGQRSGNTLQT